MQSLTIFFRKKQITIILDLKFPFLRISFYLCSDDYKEEHNIYHQPDFRKREEKQYSGYNRRDD